MMLVVIMLGDYIETLLLKGKMSEHYIEHEQQSIGLHKILDYAKSILEKRSRI